MLFESHLPSQMRHIEMRPISLNLSERSLDSKNKHFSVLVLFCQNIANRHVSVRIPFAFRTIAYLVDHRSYRVCTDLL